MALILAQFYVAYTTQERMRTALRASAQYVMNGGTDLGRLEQVFVQTYGRDSADFSSELVCSCPLSFNDDGTPAQEATAADTDEASTSSSLSLREDGGWPQCTTTCDDGGRAQSFGRFSARDEISGGITGGSKELTADIAVRLLQ